MQNEAVAGRYAKALLDLAEEAGQIKEYGEDLERFAEAIKISSELKLVLSNPSVPMEQRRQVMAALLDHMQLSRIVSNFLKLLVDRSRTLLFEQILAAYYAQSDERFGRVRGQVLTAFALKPAQHKKLEAGLSKLLGKEVLLSEVVNASLIGGLRVEISGRTYDGSLQGQLEQMRGQLSQSQLDA